MARPRRKKHTHEPHASDRSSGSAMAAPSRSPKSMVIRIGAGEVGACVSQLAKDLRRMMEPGTASRLKERRSNKLRDYTTMAGPLGVSHLLLLSRSASGNTNMRIALTPRGPTLNFRIQTYALAKDVQRVQRHPSGKSMDFCSAPLLVMNNFNKSFEKDTARCDASVVPKHLESLVTSVFQSLFPTIRPNSRPVSSLRRVVLLTRYSPQADDDGKFIVSLRHFAIRSRPTHVSREVRRVSASKKAFSASSNKKDGAVPKLNRLDDIADLFLHASGHFSDDHTQSESEVEADAEVEVLLPDLNRVPHQKDSWTSSTGKQAPKQKLASSTGKRAIKLLEIGPRLQLKLTKVEEDLGGGRVMWHDYHEKTPEAAQALDLHWADRRREKGERQQLQRKNVKAKSRDRAKDLRTGDGSGSIDEGSISTDDRIA